MRPIELMSWTPRSETNTLNMGLLLRILLEDFMFPHCANPDCTASFGNFREGVFFLFRRSNLAEVPSNSHSVEHFWLCKECCEDYTLDYRDNRSILISLLPPVTLPPQPMEAQIKAQVAAQVEAPRPPRRPRVKRRPRNTRRAPVQQSHGNPLLILAVTPVGDFIDRS
jgi:hypothetical protein